MKTNAQKVDDFHRVMGAIRPDRPTMPNNELLSFRLKLIREEYEEVTEAAEALLNGESEDISRYIHELCDLLYVAYGAIQSCGVDADPVFEEVHSANMRKLDGPRRADGKILKPEGWQPADVGRVIGEQLSVNRDLATGHFPQEA